jgi:hypothetical protein
VCAADACVVPLLPRPRSPGASPAASAASPTTGVTPATGATPATGVTPAAAGLAADEIVNLPQVTAAACLLARLAEVGLTGLIGQLPSLAELGSLLPDAAPEDVEDALTDLVRAAAEAGADAVVIRGADRQDVDRQHVDRQHVDRQDADRQDVDRSVEAVAQLADFYGVPVLGVDAEHGWAAGHCCPVGLLRPDGQWPDLARGVVLTAGDVTEWWTPQQMRSVLRERQGAGP